MRKTKSKYLFFIIQIALIFSALFLIVTNYNKPIKSTAAKAEETFNVTFIYPGVDEIETTETKAYSNRSKINPNDVACPYLHLYYEWSLIRGGEYINYDTFVVNENITLYGTMTSNFTVKFYQGDKKINEGWYNKYSDFSTYNYVPFGYVFKGLSLTKDGELLDLETYRATSRVTLYVICETQKFDVNFNIDGVLETKIVEYNKSVSIADPIKTGYIFIGWLNSATSYLEGYRNGGFTYFDSITSTKTYIASFVINKYNVTFKDEDNVIKTKEVDYRNYATIENPEKENYSFIGWSLTKNGEIVELAKYPIFEDTTFYAIFWGNPCSLKLYDENKNVLTDTRLRYGTVYSLPQISLPRNEFLGWSLTENGKVFATNEIVLTENIILYPVFGAHQYFINFYMENGSVILKKNTVEDKIENLSDSKEYYDFLGWSLIKNGEVVNLSLINISTDLNLYSKFMPVEYTVQIYGFNGIKLREIVGTYESVYFGELPFEKHYNFLGYSLTENGEIINTDNYKLTSNLSLYSQFLPIEYTINFYDKVDLVKSIKCTVKDKLENLVQEKEHYNFNGWALFENGEVVDLSLIKIESDLNLYAKFTPIKYSLEFKDYYDLISNVIKDDYNKTIVIPFANIHYGYNFDGWEDSEKSLYLAGAEYKIQGNNIFKAKYTLKENFSLATVLSDKRYIQGKYDAKDFSYKTRSWTLNSGYDANLSNVTRGCYGWLFDGETATKQVEVLEIISSVNNLPVVYVNGTNQRLGDNCFMLNLKTLILPNTLKYISFPFEYSFEKTRYIILQGDVPTLVSNNGFGNLEEIYVPDEYYNNYVNAWNFAVGKIKKYSEITMDKYILNSQDLFLFEDYKYIINDNKVEIIGLTNDGLEKNTLILPNEIDGMPVVKCSIGADCVSNNVLNTIYVNDNLEIFGTNAFNNFKNLSTITFGENSKLNTIEFSAFRYSKIAEIILPKRLSLIAEGTFNIDTLTKITILSNEPFDFDTFKNVPNILVNAKIKVPSGKVQLFKAAWNEISNKITSDTKFIISVKLRGWTLETEEQIQTHTYEFLEGQEIDYENHEYLYYVKKAEEGGTSPLLIYKSHYLYNGINSELPTYLTQNVNIEVQYLKQYFVRFQYYTMARYYDGIADKDKFYYHAITLRQRSQMILENEMPDINKYETDFYTKESFYKNIPGFEFLGWDKKIQTATEDILYTAQYKLSQIDVKYYSANNIYLKTEKINFELVPINEMKNVREWWDYFREELRNFFLLRWDNIIDDAQSGALVENLYKFLNEQHWANNQIFIMVIRPNADIECDKGIFGQGSVNASGSSFRYLTGYAQSNNYVYFLDTNNLYVNSINYNFRVEYGTKVDEVIDVVTDSLNAIRNVIKNVWNFIIDYWLYIIIGLVVVFVGIPLLIFILKLFINLISRK